MAYEVVMSYHLHMPSYFLGTFTEYPFLGYTKKNGQHGVQEEIPTVAARFFIRLPAVL